MATDEHGWCLTHDRAAPHGPGGIMIACDVVECEEKARAIQEFRRRRPDADIKVRGIWLRNPDFEKYEDEMKQLRARKWAEQTS